MCRCHVPCVRTAQANGRIASLLQFMTLLLGACLFCHPALHADSLPFFRDVTTQAGISFHHMSGKTEERRVVETMGSGAVFLDYDSDGDLDLYCVNSGYVPGTSDKLSPGNVLYQNDGHGYFTDVTGTSGTGDSGYGMAAAAADYDSDGDQDLYVANFGQDVLYQNNGDGTFSDVTEAAGIDNELWAVAVVYFDFDVDGDLDIFVVNYLMYDVSMPVSTYRGVVGYGHPRLYQGTADALYRNNGDGTFIDVAEQVGVTNAEEGRGMGAVVLDYDNDGLPDIYVTNDTSRNFLYHNNGDGTFTDESLFAGTGYDGDGIAEGSMGADSGDYNKDGWLDILIANSETSTLYRNHGDGTFVDETLLAGLSFTTYQLTGYSPLFLDYENDGDLDIFFANGHPQDVIHELTDETTYAQRDQLFRNNGDGTYTEVSGSAGPYFQQMLVGRATAGGDYDNDGDTDIFIVNSNQPAILLRNEIQDNGNWIRVRLTGVQSNRDGIGARIRLVCQEDTQLAEVKSGSGYASGSDLRVLFGLGKQVKAETIEVQWPSGIQQVIQNVSANQMITVVEENQTSSE